MVSRSVLDEWSIVEQFPCSFPLDVINMLIDLIYNTFDDVFEQPLPEDVFISDLADKIVDIVVAPTFGKPMKDGLTSPLQNKVEEIMLYLPPDEYAYLEDI